MRQRILFTFCFMALAIVAMPPSVLAQDEAKLPFELLDSLSDKAVDSVEVTLDESLLRMAAAFLNDKDPDEAKAKALVTDLKGVYVRILSFDAPGMYSEEDIKPLRDKLKLPGWSRLVNVRSRRAERSDMQVMLLNRDGKVKGMAILATGPKELVLVNIIGSIDLEKVRELEGAFGIPKLELEREKGAQEAPKE